MLCHVFIPPNASYFSQRVILTVDAACRLCKIHWDLLILPCLSILGNRDHEIYVKGEATCVLLCLLPPEVSRIIIMPEFYGLRMSFGLWKNFTYVYHWESFDHNVCKIVRLPCQYLRESYDSISFELFSLKVHWCDWREIVQDKLITMHAVDPQHMIPWARAKSPWEKVWSKIQLPVIPPYPSIKD